MTETLLTRDQILQAEDLPSETVEVPEWGGSVIVRGLTGAERGLFQTSILPKDGNVRSGGMDMREAEIRLVAYCVVDEGGKRLFTEKDLKALGKKSGMAISRVTQIAMRLSGFTQEDLQELTENFDAAQSDGSGSG